MGGIKVTCYELLHTKAELLCYGVKASEEAKKRMEIDNRYVLEKGFMHAAHFSLGRLIVNTCISEGYCKDSPYEIRATKSRFSLYKENRFISSIKVLRLPEWCNTQISGKPIGDYLRPHSEQCIACWPSLMCNYFIKDEQCKFCSMGSYRLHDILKPQIVVDMIKVAIENNQNYEIALSGGTCQEPDHAVDYFAEICNGARKVGAKYISVETAPPNDLDRIDHLKLCGATAIIMNLEIANDKLRKEICPGKSKITKEQYYEAYIRGVNVFGPGNVSCVLIAGIQPKDDIITEAKKLIAIGVVPTIIPFKPLDGCDMNNGKVSNPEELIDISIIIDKMLDDEGLVAAEQKGCTKCNGCSLETAAAFI